MKWRLEMRGVEKGPAVGQEGPFATDRCVHCMHISVFCPITIPSDGRAETVGVQAALEAREAGERDIGIGDGGAGGLGPT